MDAPTDLLVLHACTAPGFAACAQGGQVRLALVNGSGKKRRPLLDAVHEVMRDGGESVKGVIVTRGPGSFTGIRVAIATAQGLAFARSWTLWACDSLLLYAAAWMGSEAPVAVCQDARRGEVYAALYDVSGAVPRHLVPPFCATPEEARVRLQLSEAEGTALRWTGSGAALVRPQGDPVFPATAERLSTAALHLAAAGGLTATDVFALEPIYLRRPDVRPPHASAE